MVDQAAGQKPLPESSTDEQVFGQYWCQARPQVAEYLLTRRVDPRVNLCYAPQGVHIHITRLLLTNKEKLTRMELDPTWAPGPLEAQEKKKTRRADPCSETHQGKNKNIILTC